MEFLLFLIHPIYVKIICITTEKESNIILCVSKINIMCFLYLTVSKICETERYEDYKMNHKESRIRNWILQTFTRVYKDKY